MPLSSKLPREQMDVAQTVRPQIDRIQAVLISALVNRTNARSRASCRAEVAKAIQDRSVATQVCELCERSASAVHYRGTGAADGWGGCGVLPDEVERGPRMQRQSESLTSLRGNWSG
jgi:hypothetical protein